MPPPQERWLADLSIKARPRAGGKTHETLLWLLEDLDRRGVVMASEAMARHHRDTAVQLLAHGDREGQVDRRTLEVAITSVGAMRAGKFRGAAQSRTWVIEDVEYVLEELLRGAGTLHGVTTSRRVVLT